MDDTSIPTATHDQADEDFLSYTVSDEALEAAAGTEREAVASGVRAVVFVGDALGESVHAACI
jgi:hypothetical protein